MTNYKINSVSATNFIGIGVIAWIGGQLLATNVTMSLILLILPIWFLIQSYARQEVIDTKGKGGKL